MRTLFGMNCVLMSNEKIQQNAQNPIDMDGSLGEPQRYRRRESLFINLSGAGDINGYKGICWI
jgi:hypothetical protein